MDSHQVVNYIAGQLKAGHSETALRQHMINHGWSEGAVSDAFKKYHETHHDPEPAKPEPEPKKEKHKHTEFKIPRRGGKLELKRSRARSLATVVVVLGLLGGGLYLFHKHVTQPAAPVVGKPTIQQRQSLDSITLGGAVGQYARLNNETLPEKVAPAPDGTNSVVLCGSTCDPATWQVSALYVYKPSGVSMVPYSPTLKATDASQLILVTGARCTPDGSELSLKDVRKLSMAILYATKDTTGFQQHCVIL